MYIYCARADGTQSSGVHQHPVSQRTTSVPARLLANEEARANCSPKLASTKRKKTHYVIVIPVHAKWQLTGLLTLGDSRRVNLEWCACTDWKLLRLLSGV